MDTSSDTSIIKSTNNFEKKEFNDAVFMFYKLKPLLVINNDDNLNDKIIDIIKNFIL